MLRFFISTFCLLLLCQTVIAQKQSGTKGPKKSFFSGNVVDETGSGVPFANIAVFKSSDSTLAGGTATDESGFFKIELATGNYYISFSFLSYKTRTLYNVTLAPKPTTLGNIVLQQQSEQLEEVEIIAEKSQMELKLDKRVFNIEKDLANAGANAAEILDNIPSVQVDVEGNISLRGSENVRVLIDGKPSTITGTSTADVLRQFQGSMIERVEIITNPSARYDAEGEVGIINIILKKNKQKGINGSIESVVGYPDNHRLSFNLNYRTPKYNLFTSYGISYRDSPGSSSATFDFSDDSIADYTSEAERMRRSLGQNVRLGADLFLNEWNTITVSGFYRYSDQENIAELVYKDINANNEFFQTEERNDIEDETGENLEFSLNHTKKYKKEGQKWSTDFQWSESDDLEQSDIDQTNFRTNDLLLQETSNIEANRTILAQTDYVHPLKNKRQIEGGIRTTFRTVENVFTVSESENGGPFNILSQFNNDFLYVENVYAAYLQFGNEIGKLSYQLGVRGEQTDIDATLRLTNESNPQNYFNLFPSAFFTYKFSKLKQLQLSYSKRINRPNYRNLLPFQTFSDNRNLWRGNPELEAEFTDSYELGFLRYFEKGSFFTSLYYRHRENVIDRIVATDNNGITTRFPVNLATEDNLGLELNSSYQFSKNVSFNANFNFYRAQRSGSFEGQSLNFDVFTMNSRGTLKAKAFPKVDVQASFNYRAPQASTQGRRKAIYRLDLSAGKDVLDGKGTVVASVRDVFNTRKRRSITDTDFLYSESEFQWRARQFLLSFSYRINEKKKRNKGENRDFGGGEDF